MLSIDCIRDGKENKGSRDIDLKKIMAGILIFFIFWIPKEVYAQIIETIEINMGETQTDEKETSEMNVDETQTEELEIDFSEWEEVIGESNLSDMDVGIEELFSLLVQGKTKEVGKILIEGIKNILFGEIGEQKEILVSLFFLLLIAGIFATLTESFHNGLTSQTGFYVTYLLLFSLSFSSFYTSCQIVMETLGQIMGFMKVVIPVYCLFVAVSSGQEVGTGMYEMLFLALYGLEWLMRHIIFPSVKIYVVFSMLKELSTELKLERLCNLMKNTIQWVLKAVTVFVLGLSTVQSMILPTAEGVKYLAIQKSIKALPAGEAALAASNFITGSSVIIKNSVGITAVILLLLFLVIPFVKIGIMLVGFMGLGALMEPISQKSFIKMLESVATGGMLLWKMISTVALIFLVSICIISFATNMRLYGI